MSNIQAKKRRCAKSMKSILLVGPGAWYSYWSDPNVSGNLSLTLIPLSHREFCFQYFSYLRVFRLIVGHVLFCIEWKINRNTKFNVRSFLFQFRKFMRNVYVFHIEKVDTYVSVPITSKTGETGFHLAIIFLSNEPSRDLQFDRGPLLGCGWSWYE